MSTGKDYCVIFAFHASSRWLPRRMRAARAREIYFFMSDSNILKKRKVKKMKNILSVALVAAALWAAMPATAQSKVIYTGDIAKKVMGYQGPTPLNITISNGKIESIEALANQESPKYMRRAERGIFPHYIGKTVSQALKLKVDAVTGATYTSNALLQNIKLGLEQARKSGKKNGHSRQEVAQALLLAPPLAPQPDGTTSQPRPPSAGAVI